MLWIKYSCAVAGVVFVAASLFVLSSTQAQVPPPAEGPDYDGDGVVGVSDFIVWENLPEASDMDGNGSIALNDFYLFFPIDIYSVGPDFDGNGVVEFTDYLKWMNAPGAPDLDGDGRVGDWDFDLFYGVPVNGIAFDPNNPPSGFRFPTPPDGGPDYDGDGAVGVSDFIVWVDLPKASDLDGSGSIGPEDFDLFFPGSPIGSTVGDQPPGYPNAPPVDIFSVGPDFDGNGIVEFSDLIRWAGSPEAPDLDGSGLLGVEDFDLFYGVPVYGITFNHNNPPLGFRFPTPPAGPRGGPDYDGDGYVGFSDFIVWVDLPEASDLDGSGLIDPEDFDLFFAGSPIGSTVGDQPPVFPNDPPVDIFSVGPDFDGNGVVEFPDFLQWANSARTPDLDRNGTLGVEDFDLFYGVPVYGIAFDPDNPPQGFRFPTQPDYDGDGLVGFSDFIAWVDFPEASDLDGSGSIDPEDFNLFFPDYTIGTVVGEVVRPYDPPVDIYSVGPDFDGNGIVEFPDFIRWAGSPESPDLDGSGLVGPEDFDLFYGVPVYGIAFDPDNPPQGFRFPSPPSAGGPDFDGDGTIGFGDFLQFASVYGQSTGDARFNSRFDLDGNGNIDFPDFVTFAGVFGQPANRAFTKPLGTRSDLNQDMGLHIVTRAVDNVNEVKVTVGLTDGQKISGYSVLLNFDPTVLTLLDAYTVGASLFSGDGVAIQTMTEDGLLLSDIRLNADDASEGLITLRFGLADRERGSVDISEAFVSDGLGGIVELTGVRMDEVRVLPRGYGMDHNFPNPFNPETQIGFQLPER